MKKINLVFIGECIIIVLLLLVLGVLLKNNGKNVLGKESIIENGTVSEKMAEVEMSSVESPVNETVGSGIVNVSEYINTSTESVYGGGEDATISENMIRQGKFLYGKNIVVFGDSIWNAARGKDGISEHIQEATGATVYNCAIGGTTAAVVGDDISFDNWTSNSFNGMLYVARKLMPAEQILEEGEVVRDIIKQVDFNETDYVFIAYGLNDFFSDVSIYPKEYNELTNYVGALRNGIGHLKLNYPHLQIVVVSPTYTKMFEGEKQFEIGDYVEAARGVAEELEVEFLDMFHVLGNNAESRTEHLGDGVHMSAEGRKVYADAVVWFLNELEAK